MELSKLPDLCKLLENVCTARDFLLEVGGQPDKPLSGFMVNFCQNLKNRFLLISSLGFSPSLYR